MPEFSALRMALDEWKAATTDDDRARAAARVVQLAPPGKLWDLVSRLDELEAIRTEHGSESD